MFGLVFPLRSWRPAPNRRRQNNPQTQSQRQMNSSQERQLFVFLGLDCSFGERQHSQTNFSFNNHLSSCGLLNGWFALLLAQPLWNAAKKESLLLLRRKRRAFFMEGAVTDLKKLLNFFNLCLYWFILIFLQQPVSGELMVE